MLDAMKEGFVYLVGAGRGRADLITVRGAEILKSADCVPCDKPAELGVKLDISATGHTIDGLLDSIEKEELHNGIS